MVSFSLWDGRTDASSSVKIKIWDKFDFAKKNLDLEDDDITDELLPKPRLKKRVEDKKLRLQNKKRHLRQKYVILMSMHYAFSSMENCV